MTLKRTAQFAGIVGLLFATALFIAFTFSSNQVQGSVSQGNDYTATSTAASAVYGAKIIGGVLKTGYGSLGSVVITGANTGIVNFYNATTTDKNKRTGQTATTTILIASLPASLAAGTYVFDATFTDGLYLDVVTGIIPTTTVTWR